MSWIAELNYIPDLTTTYLLSLTTTKEFQGKDSKILT